MKNSLFIGAAIGIVFPVFAYIFTVYTDLQTSFFSDKPIAIYVIAAVINLVIFRFSYRAGNDSFAKGVLLTTFLAMLVLVFGTGLKI